MKSYTKAQLADAAGVSPETFRRWLRSDRAFLEANGIRSTTKLFPKAKGYRLKARRGSGAAVYGV